MKNTYTGILLRTISIKNHHQILIKSKRNRKFCFYINLLYLMYKLTVLSGFASVGPNVFHIDLILNIHIQIHSVNKFLIN